MEEDDDRAPGTDEQEDIKLPQALERVLAFKDVRTQQIGLNPQEIERLEKGETIDEDEGKSSQLKEFYDEGIEDDEEEEETKTKETKNRRKKKKKKKCKQRKPQAVVAPRPVVETEDEENIEIEYVAEDMPMSRTDPFYFEFRSIFKSFQMPEPDALKVDAGLVPGVVIKPVTEEVLGPKARAVKELEEAEEDGDETKAVTDDKNKLSKKKMKKQNRLSVAELKQLVSRPDVVEMHDVTAQDPKLLVQLKATRNTVPVPRHWCFKRKYLQGKRGFEKAPFDLPDFIKHTGIMEMRQALQDKEEQKNLKAKMREKVRPKLGKIDIDYQKLHDAFFKYQTKPKMSVLGDLYYEGKEFETRLREKKPGNLSDDLRTSLGMPLGPNADKYPPPWLIAMQRYGPPPSYPNLKIPGLNAPIPPGCSFGYHAGGWGKPPVDETGKPLYGDVFGTQQQDTDTAEKDEDIDQGLWGELESESEDESEIDSESDEEIEQTGLITPAETGLETPSGVTSVPVGMETPDMIELRKKRIEDAMDQGGDTPALYQVLPEKRTAVGAGMMGSTHVYDINTVGGIPLRKPDGSDGIDVALNPDELDLDPAALQAKYEQTRREQQAHLEKEDLSDMVADHAARQAKKRKKQQQHQEGKSTKKYREFKF